MQELGTQHAESAYFRCIDSSGANNDYVTADRACGGLSATFEGQTMVEPLGFAASPREATLAPP